MKARVRTSTGVVPMDLGDLTLGKVKEQLQAGVWLKDATDGLIINPAHVVALAETTAKEVVQELEAQKQLEDASTEENVEKNLEIEEG